MVEVVSEKSKNIPVCARHLITDPKERKAARLERKQTREELKTAREYQGAKLQRTLNMVLSALIGENDSIPFEVLEKQIGYLRWFNIQIKFKNHLEISE